jgi:lipoprotein-releasing system permease protein
LRIALRFLKSSPGQTALIILGISVGIATQIFVGSIIVGLQADLLNTTIGSAAHVTIKAPKESDPVRLTKKMQELFANDPRVKRGTVLPARAVSALFSNGTDTTTLGVIGGRLDQLDSIFKISRHMVAGTASLGSRDILLGKDFAEKFGVRVGETVSMRFQNNSSGSFRVAGIYDLGSAQFNLRNAFVSGDVARSVLGWRTDEYSDIEVQLNNPYDSIAVAQDWRRELPGVSVVEWQGQNKSLLAGLVSQSVSSYMIQAFVLIAVALGIASTLAIAAVQKTRQIGILKAMGLSDRGAGQVFLWQAAILGIGGSLGGIVTSYALLALFSFAPTPFKITPQPALAALSAVIGILIAVLSSLIPIRTTSRLDPIEVIQGG